ncbi:MAG: hypothetical protein OEZ39_07355 [Gammaproteobacteria bacterium]|nr:hypothetical protein [Gammaproteobacteria bacterium]MDH5651675.1 hypothetical protein [Gammaproteobacteria bacterium]
MTPIEPFYKAYRGAFSNLLRWHELEAFWQVLRRDADQGWYVYQTDSPPPAQPLSAEELQAFIEKIDTRLHTEHTEDYCGIVYVDSRTEPGFIKIYDPNNLGVVCGIGREPIFPGWIISRLAPLSLDGLPPLTEQKSPWWRRLLPWS